MVAVIDDVLVAKSLISLLSGLNSQNKEILKKEDEIIEKLDTVLKKLDVIEENTEKINQKLDEQILRDCRAGFRHLKAATTASNDRSKEIELQLARQIFENLINLDPSQVTEGTSGKQDNKLLMIYGYYGSFWYFNFMNDERNAAIQVYECIGQLKESKYLIFALEIFPSIFFGDNYYKTIQNLNRKIFEMGEQSKDLESQWSRIGQFQTAGTVGAAVAASFIALPVGLVILGGLVGSHVVTRNVGSRSEACKERYARMLEKHKDVLNQLFTECEERKDVLQNSKVSDLLCISLKQDFMPFVAEIENTLKESNQTIPNSNEISAEVRKLTGAFDQRDVNQVEAALSNIGNLLERLSSTVQQTSDLFEKWKGLTEQLNESGLL